MLLFESYLIEKNWYFEGANEMSFLFHVGDVLVGGKEPIDDSVDKIHRKCTIVFLLLLSLPLFTKQFAGEPIECFTPTYFTDAQARYVNSYCWTVSTFYHTTTSARSSASTSTSSDWDQSKVTLIGITLT